MGSGRGSGAGSGRGKGRMGGLCEPCERAGRCVCTVICLFLVGGPAAICGGLYFLVSATRDGRSADIASYNAAVQAWESTHRAAFSQAVFSFSGPFAQGVIAQPIDEGTTDASAMRSADNDGEIKYDYPHLRFRAAAGSILGPSQQLLLTSSGSCANPASCTMSVYAQPASQYGAQPSTVFPAVGIQPVSNEEVSRNSLTYERSGKTYSCDTSGFSSSSSSCAYICSRRGAGYTWTNGRCMRSLMVSSYCLRVTNGGLPGGPWRAASEIGCFNNSPEKWSIPLATTPATFAVLDPNMPLEIRSEYDPFVVAYRLTDGSLWFGLTTAQKLGIGVGLLALGGLLLLCPCGIIIYLVRTHKQQQQGQSYAQMGAPGAVPFGGAPAMGYPVAGDGKPPKLPQPGSAPSYTPAAYPQTAAPYPQPAAYPQAGAYPQAAGGAYPPASAYPPATAAPGPYPPVPTGQYVPGAEPTAAALMQPAYQQPGGMPAENPYYKQ